MARKPQQSTGMSFPDPGPTVFTGFRQMAILKVDTNSGKIDTTSSSSDKGLLWLNPESIDDEKSSNWIATQVPGQSNPIMSWASGGPRNITFEALVTKDTSDFLNAAADPLAGVIDNAVSAVGNIASAFAGISLPSISGLLGSAKPGPGEELSIENNLNYYRSLLYPTYVGGRLYSSPPLCVLAFGRMLGSRNSIPADDITSAHDLWVLTSLRIKVSKSLPNLTPMEAVVSFTFSQYAMASLGADHYQDQPGSSGSVGSPSIGSALSGKIKGLF